MAEQPHTPEQDRLLAAQVSTAESIAQWSSVMVVISAGLVLLAFAPDSLVISDSAKTEMPFIGSASIKLVLIAGPLILLLVRLFLSSYFRHWNRLNAQLGERGSQEDYKLSVMSNRRLRQWTGFVHFPLVAIVLVLTTWKGLAFPVWGEAMAILTIGVVAWLTYWAAHSGRCFNLLILIVIVVITPVVIYFELMEPVTERGTSTDLDEDRYRGSFFWVNCSSPIVRGPEPAAQDSKYENGQDGCIGKESDWYNTKALVTETGQGGMKSRFRVAITRFGRFYVIQRKLTLSGSEMKRADLRHMNLRWASMTHSDLSDSLFRYAELQHATATNAVFEGADFGHAQMQNVFFRRAKLQKATFWLANLKGATLVNAKLGRARIMNADLTYADLERADMVKADLRSTILRNANLQKAKLQNARFGKVGERRVTDLTDANLQCADLRNVDLSKTEGLEKAQVSKACMDEKTGLPPELSGTPRDVPPECKQRCR